MVGAVAAFGRHAFVDLDFCAVVAVVTLKVRIVGINISWAGVEDASMEN
jgi:hypothetical protein